MKAINPEGSIIITLRSWDNDVEYKSIAAANMARWEPALDCYNCKQCLDGIPKNWKNEIDQFHRQRNVISPNKKYHATRQHPLYTSQTQTARVEHN